MWICICVPVAMAMSLGAASDAAFVIDDRSFFAGIGHEFLDFEARGDGTPLDLFPDQVIAIPPDEYSAVGVRFATQFAWEHIGAPPSEDPEAVGSSSDALAAVGSWPTFAVGVGGAWAIDFLTPVRAFGVGVVQLDFAEFAAPSPDITTTITAFDDSGKQLGVVRLWVDTVDGGFGGAYAGGLFGDDWSVFNYGFMGLATTEPIARLEFTNVRQSLIDDLHVSAVPSPGAGAALALLGLGALGRRRR